MIEIFRQYLEIKNLNELNDVKKPNDKCKIEILENPDFELNKYFYYNWVCIAAWLFFALSAGIVLRFMTDE